MSSTWRTCGRGPTQLADFVAAADQRYGFGGRKPIAVGFSNGANIAAALLLLRPETLGGALLIRAMVPLVPESQPDLAGHSGSDQRRSVRSLVPPAQSEALAALLDRAGATVKLQWITGGHALTREDLETGRQWFGVSSLSQDSDRQRW